MSAFTNPLTITLLDNWRLWRLEQPLIYEIGSLGSGKLITVPKGFVTDGATVPRFLWWLLPVWGQYAKAVVLHDWACLNVARSTPVEHVPTRIAADKLLLEAMTVLQVNAITKYMVYIGARMGGLRRNKDYLEKYNHGLTN